MALIVYPLRTRGGHLALKDQPWDCHLRQKAALRFWQIRIRAVLQRSGILVAARESDSERSYQEVPTPCRFSRMKSGISDPTGNERQERNESRQIKAFRHSRVGVLSVDKRVDKAEHPHHGQHDEIGYSLPVGSHLHAQQADQRANQSKAATNQACSDEPGREIGPLHLESRPIRKVADERGKK